MKAEGGASPPPKPKMLIPQLTKGELEITQAISDNWVRVGDLFRAMDTDGNGVVDKREFRLALKHLGLQVCTHAHPCTPMHTHAHTCTYMRTHAHTCTMGSQAKRHEVDDIFNKWDADGSGELDFEEVRMCICVHMCKCAYVHICTRKCTYGHMCMVAS